jgi:competence protein ComEC
MFLSDQALQKAPFIRLLIPLIAGVILHPFVPKIISGSNWLSFVLTGIVIFTGTMQVKFRSVRLGTCFGIILNLCLMGVGTRLCFLNNELNFSDHYSHQLRQKQTFICVHLVSGCQEKLKSYKAIAQVDCIGQPGKWIPVSGNLLIHFGKTNRAADLRYGARFCARAILRPIAGPSNPAMFDYRQYMAHRNIFQEASLSDLSWLPLSGRSGNRLIRYCQDKREQMLELLRRGKVSGDAFAVGAALMLGYEDKLNPDLLQAYSGSGVLHILSVSGLHVAVLFAVLQALLFFLDRNTISRLIKSFILLTVLWAYAILTGLSPSVLRSAAMLSFVVLAGLLNRDALIYNSLSASAFCLLVANPNNLFDVGFQLSYLAVYGIVFLYPILYKLKKSERPIGSFLQRSRTWLSSQIWILCCVSIAAQIITFPLGLFYFHQFPTYFLLSNLVIIPLSSAVMYCGIGCFMLAAVPYAGKAMLSLFSLFLQILNETVRFFAALPGAVIKSVPMDTLEILALYLLLGLGIAFVQKPRAARLYVFLYAGILFCFGEGIIHFRRLMQSTFTVYAIPHATAIDFIEGRKLYTLSDTLLTIHPALQKYLIQPNREASGVLSVKSKITHPGSSLYGFRGSRFLRVEGKNSSLSEITSMNIRYMIVSQNARFDPLPFTRSLRFKILIADGSCSTKDIRYWKNICKNKHITFWSVTEQGAFESMEQHLN